MKDTGKKKAIILCASVLFVLSCTVSCLVFSGANIYQMKLFENVAAEIYNQQESSNMEMPHGTPVIVIDAGHGGLDGGASAADGTLEKELTLNIARELEKVISEFPVKIIMTRMGDNWLADDDERPVRTKKREDLKRRKEIIDSTGAELAISIHLNSFPQDASVYGPQVFYPAEHEARTDVRMQKRTSREFAESVQKSLEINIDDGNERSVMSKDDILLFKDASTPVILVECGFLSSYEEAEKLKTAEYQQLLAESIWQGINEILCLEKKKEMQIIYSTNKNA